MNELMSAFSRIRFVWGKDRLPFASMSHSGERDEVLAVNRLPVWEGPGQREQVPGGNSHDAHPASDARVTACISQVRREQMRL